MNGRISSRQPGHGRNHGVGSQQNGRGRNNSNHSRVQAAGGGANTRATLSSNPQLVTIEGGRIKI